MQPGKRLVDKVAIVTGGASGIGAETARQFGLHGATVVVADINAELGQAVTQAIADAGGTAVFKEHDVVVEPQWEALIADTLDRFDKLDVMANVAGTSGRDMAGMAAPTSALIEEQSLDNWNGVLEINATGVFLGTKHAIVPMRQAGGGSIINISSICGIIGAFGSGPYNASKGAVRIFSKTAAAQYAGEGIRVNSVHPGFVDTPMTQFASSNNEGSRARLQATPMGRFGQPIDIAMGCLFLASDESAWMTGAELVIDGGMTAV